MTATDRALIIGVSLYPHGFSSLPGVAADAREISMLLGSSKGAFQPNTVTLLNDGDATRSNVLAALQDVFESAQPDDTVFVYLAGHGTVARNGDYHFIPFDAQ